MTAAAGGAALAAHPSWMELDGAALQFNLAEIRRRAGPAVRMIASVKANAYGHGILPVARLLAAGGVDMLATGSFAEACTIRQAGIDTPILMLAGALPGGMAELLAQELVPTVYDLAGAKAVSAAAGRETGVYLKVDCGLGRLGVGLDEAPALVAAIAGLDRLRLDGIYTHLSFKDAAGMAYARDRFARFEALLRRLAADGHAIPVTQALASSALLMGWRDGCNAVCPGHILYGLSPVDAELADIAPFRPVLRAIRSRVIHVADHGEGARLRGGYHLARQHRRTAVLPCGLNDGYRPAAPGQRAQVLHRGRRLTVIGVSLEHVTVDVPDHVAIAVGDAVTLAGGEGDGRIALEELAGWRGIGALDAMLSFGGRLPVLVADADRPG